MGTRRVYALVPGDDHYSEGAAALLADRNRIARECADARDECADLAARVELLEGRLAAATLTRDHTVGVIRQYIAHLDADFTNDVDYDWGALTETRTALRLIVDDHDLGEDNPE